MNQTKKAILYIYTENTELREKYAQRVNFTADAGIDLYCPEEVYIYENTLANKIRLQIQCVLRDADDESRTHHYFLLPRSSIIKTPLRLSNSTGVIDANYRGEIIAVVDCLQRGSNQSDEDVDYEIKKHERLFQIVAPWAGELCVKLVDSVDELGLTDRGAGGFGSTGK